jgi:hypothetical protein
VLRHLRQVAELQAISSYRTNSSRRVLRVAAMFLDHLGEHGRRLDECAQADIDRWFALGPHDRDHARPFLRWCRQQRELPPVQLPPLQHTTGVRISQQQRLAFIRRVLTEHTMPAADRVLALLILLYAQPLVKIARLTIKDVHRDDDQVLIRLGDPPTPLPQPFADVLLDYLDNRLNLTTAGGADNPFLFPGQPMHTTSLRLRLRNLGLPHLDGRTTTIRELLREAPAPVVAGMLGYHPVTTEAMAAEVGTTWSRYAAGDHTRLTSN